LSGSPTVPRRSKISTEWVYCTESGGPLDADNLRHRVFYKLLEKAELRRVRFHDLHHTFDLWVMSPF
jgi:integrase